MIKQFTSVYGRFEYELTLDKRRTIAIHVKQDQSVIVKAPLRAKEDEIAEFIESKLRWIMKHQRRYAAYKPSVPKKYINGESFRYLGADYELQVEQAAGRETICVERDKLKVFSKRPHSWLYTRKLLDEWYAKETKRVFSEQLKICSERFAPDNHPCLAVRKMKTRLGSYSPKMHRVCLNFDLIEVEQRLIDYVIIHELCHITHHYHNEDFYNLLTVYLPEWKRLESELDSSLLSMTVGQ